MTADPVVAGLVALPTAAGILVLPGFAVEWLAGSARSRVRRGAPPEERVIEPRATRLVLAVCSGLAATVLVGGALLAFGVFSPTRLAVVLAVLAVLGLVPAVRWLWQQRAALAYGLVAIGGTAPLWFVVFERGYKPALSYQWFYWHLGQELQVAHGIPTSVSEWGSSVRWQPDYLDFNLISQAFLGATPGVEPASAVSAWKIPLALFLASATFLALRLWFSRTGAVLGTTGLCATDVYVDKITNNTPEALGLAFGLLCVWLGVQAIRCDRPAWLALSGVTLGLTVSIHAIAATVAGMLLAAGIVSELVVRRTHALRWLAGAVIAAVLCGLTLTGLGLALQGRASPLGGAAKPHGVGGADPTYQFLQYSNGHFSPKPFNDALWPNINQAWTGMSLVSGPGAVLIAVMAVGLVGLIWNRGRPRLLQGALTAVVLGAILSAGVVWFLTQYDTYVPQHTGRTRLSVYAAVVETMLLVAGTDVILGLARSATRRLASSRRRSGRLALLARVGGAAAAAIAAFVICALPTARRIDARPAMGQDGRAALAELKTIAPPGSVALSNVATRGTVEFFTGLENPLEGRQPLIEDVDVLLNASEYLERLHRFLADPHPGELGASLGAGWLVITSQPRELGTGLKYGTPAPNFAQRAGLDVVWSRGTVQILRSPEVATAVRSVGAAKSLGLRFLLTLAAILVLLGVATAALRRLLGAPERRRF